MNFNSRLVYIIFFGAILVSSCTENLQNAELEIKPSPRQAPLSTKAEVQLNSLNTLAPEKSKNGALVEDLRLILLAEISQKQGKHKQAADYYFEALKIARGRFGRSALEGWILNYAHSLEQRTKSTFVSRILLDVSQNGALSPYMQAKGIKNIDKMNKIVSKIAQKYLLADDTESGLMQFPAAPKRRGIPLEDPLLDNTAKAYCSGKGDPNYQWKAWIKKLPKPVKRYWLGLVANCKKNYKKAARHYKSSIAGLSKSRRTANLAVSSAYRLVRNLRNNAAREKAADAYVILMKMWKLKGLSSMGMGIKRQDFALERINDALWAARYRALIGDYQSARDYTTESLKLISKAFTKTHLLDPSFREKLSDYQAEAYLILANRIAIEEGNLSSAASQMVIATGIPNVSQKMKERLYWYAGFYQYFAGQLSFAVEKWETLLSITEDNSTKARVYFWASRALNKLGDNKKSKELLQNLHHDYPLNYYTVVASKEAHMTSDHMWQNNFPSYDLLVEKLNNRDYYDSIVSKSDRSLINLIKRAEIFNRAELGKWAQYSVKELDYPFKKKFDVKTDTDAFLYLSRLHFVAENYLQSIIYTTSMARNTERFWQTYPEQLLIYFPRPYSDIYARNALETSLDANLLYSVSRQESAFNRSAKSSANAYGLMQLILPTAERFAEEAGIEKEGLKEKLFEPEVTISIGSRYLKALKLHYKGFIPGILGAYNAGEYAVDTWIERRQSVDPLAWIELVPFGETRGYIKNVWRNSLIYDHIGVNIRTSRVLKRQRQSRQALMGFKNGKILTR